MANDRETKSFEVHPAAPRGERLTEGAAGDTMGGGKDADLRAHGEAGSSGVGLPPMPDNDARIHSRDDSGGRADTGADDDR